MSGTLGIRLALVTMSLVAVSVAGGVEVERARELYGRAEYQETIDTLLPWQGRVRGDRLPREKGGLG